MGQLLWIYERGQTVTNASRSSEQREMYNNISRVFIYISLDKYLIRNKYDGQHVF